MELLVKLSINRWILLSSYNDLILTIGTGKNFRFHLLYQKISWSYSCNQFNYSRKMEWAHLPWKRDFTCSSGNYVKWSDNTLKLLLCFNTSCKANEENLPLWQDSLSRASRILTRSLYFVTLNTCFSSFIAIVFSSFWSTLFPTPTANTRTFFACQEKRKIYCNL